MGSPNQLSFLPDDYLERKAQRRANAICAVLFILVMGGVGFASYIQDRQGKRVDDDYAQIEQQYLAEARRLAQVKQMTEKQKRISQQADLAASLLERVPRHAVLSEITSAAEAPNISLLELVLESKPRPKATSATEAAKTAYEQKKAARQASNTKTSGPPQPEPKVFDVFLKLTGVARTDVQVAQFLSTVSRSKMFKDANLIISDEFKVGEEKLRRFQIDMMLAPDAEVAFTEAPAAGTALELKEPRP